MHYDLDDETLVTEFHKSIISSLFFLRSLLYLLKVKVHKELATVELH